MIKKFTHGLLFILMLCVFLAPVWATTTVVSTTATLPVAISDNAQNYACLNFPVAGIPASEVVRDVSVTFGLEHQCALDMRVELRDPSNARIRQLFGNGLIGLCLGDGSFDIDGLFTFSDSAGVVMNNQIDVIPPSGNYRAADYDSQVATSLITMFRGMSAAQAIGNWQLCYRDTFIFDTGQIKAPVSLTIVSSVPTSASVTLSGQALSSFGQPVVGAIVQLSNLANGQTKYARTNMFGFFRFEGVSVGQTYMIEVLSKGHRFNPQTVTVNAEIEGIVLRLQ